MPKTKTTKKAAEPKTAKASRKTADKRVKENRAKKVTGETLRKQALAQVRENIAAIEGEPAKEAKVKKVGALSAAAQVLAESKEPMNAQQMIKAMTAKGLWTSPGGKTPHATLYAAIIREINAKGNDARFKKVDRGQFAANA